MPLSSILSNAALNGISKELAAVKAGEKGPFPWLALLEALLPLLLQFLPLILNPPKPAA